MNPAAWSKLAFGVACVALTLASAALVVALRSPPGPPATPPAPSAPPREPSAPAPARAEAGPPPLTPEQRAALGRARRAVWEEAGASWSQPDAAKGPELGPGRASAVLATSYGGGPALFRSRSTPSTLSMTVTRGPDDGTGPVDARLHELLGRAERRMHAGAAARAERLDLDGVRGVVARAAETVAARGPVLQWVGYRERGGTIERVEVSFEVKGPDVARHLPTALAVLYSFRFFGAG
ncbi:MAG TPA: hypothetical protein VFS43_34820 [Polyangiaceae bacterium]|nr:hypothetical protein [Polyangiaceae bacterium]